MEKSPHKLKNSPCDDVFFIFHHIPRFPTCIYIGFARKKYDQPKKHPLATGYTLQRSTGFEPSYHSWLQILVKRSPETAVWIKMIKNAQCQLSIHIYIYNMYIYIYNIYITYLRTTYIHLSYIYIIHPLVDEHSDGIPWVSLGNDLQLVAYP